MLKKLLTILVNSFFRKWIYEIEGNFSAVAIAISVFWKV